MLKKRVLPVLLAVFCIQASCVDSADTWQQSRISPCYRPECGEGFVIATWKCKYGSTAQDDANQTSSSLNELCDPESKPADIIACGTRLLCKRKYQWQYYDAKPCRNRCSGQKYAVARCVDTQSNVTVNSSLCLRKALLKPNTFCGNCVAEWQTGEWYCDRNDTNKCNNRQSRQIFCVERDLKTGEIFGSIDNQICNQTTMPSVFRWCSDGLNVCKKYQLYGHWSQCRQHNCSSNTGVQRRRSTTCVLETNKDNHTTYSAGYCFTHRILIFENKTSIRNEYKRSCLWKQPSEECAAPQISPKLNNTIHRKYIQISRMRNITVKTNSDVYILSKKYSRSRTFRKTNKILHETDITFECSETQLPINTISWYKIKPSGQRQNDFIGRGKLKLRFSEATKINGTYMCCPHNSCAQNSTVNIWIQSFAYERKERRFARNVGANTKRVEQEGQSNANNTRVWMVGMWSRCDATCTSVSGSSPIQKRSIRCEEVTNVMHSMAVVLETDQCREHRRPVETRKCNTFECPKLVAKQTNTSQCTNECKKPGFAASPESEECRSADRTFPLESCGRNRTKKECQNESCQVYIKIGNWSQCPNRCGKVYQTRSVTCRYRVNDRIAFWGWCRGKPGAKEKEAEIRLCKPIRPCAKFQCRDTFKYCALVKRGGLCQQHYFNFRRCCITCKKYRSKHLNQATNKWRK